MIAKLINRLLHYFLNFGSQHPAAHGVLRPVPTLQSGFLGRAARARYLTKTTRARTTPTASPALNSPIVLFLFPFLQRTKEILRAGVRSLGVWVQHNPDKVITYGFITLVVVGATFFIIYNWQAFPVLPALLRFITSMGEGSQAGPTSAKKTDETSPPSHGEEGGPSPEDGTPPPDGGGPSPDHGPDGGRTPPSGGGGDGNGPEDGTPPHSPDDSRRWGPEDDDPSPDRYPSGIPSLQRKLERQKREAAAAAQKAADEAAAATERADSALLNSREASRIADETTAHGAPEAAVERAQQRAREAHEKYVAAEQAYRATPHYRQQEEARRSSVHPQSLDYDDDPFSVTTDEQRQARQQQHEATLRAAGIEAQVKRKLDDMIHDIMGEFGLIRDKGPFPPVKHASDPDQVKSYQKQTAVRVKNATAASKRASTAEARARASFNAGQVDAATLNAAQAAAQAAAKRADSARKQLKRADDAVQAAEQATKAKDDLAYGRTRELYQAVEDAEAHFQAAEERSSDAGSRATQALHNYLTSHGAAKAATGDALAAANAEAGAAFAEEQAAKRALKEAKAALAAGDPSKAIPSLKRKDK